MELILYGSRDSGHCYKVALALSLVGLPFEYRLVDLKVPRPERPADFLAASRFAEVPVLLIDGIPFNQSEAILMELAERVGRFGGESRESLAECRMWLFWEAGRIGFSVPALRLSLNWLTDTPSQVNDWLRTKVHQDLRRLERELGHRAFLLGDSITIADVACSAYLFWPEHIDVDLGYYPRLTRWLNRIRSEAGWKAPASLLVATSVAGGAHA